MQLTEIEDQVLRIWEETLKVSGFVPEDGFFDAGGDSLLAVAVAERIKKNSIVSFMLLSCLSIPRSVQSVNTFWR